MRRGNETNLCGDEMRFGYENRVMCYVVSLTRSLRYCSLLLSISLPDASLIFAQKGNLQCRNRNSPLFNL
jgi:hypothetical protein